MKVRRPVYLWGDLQIVVAYHSSLVTAVDLEPWSLLRLKSAAGRFLPLQVLEVP
jgi:hypothetical protein